MIFIFFNRLVVVTILGLDIFEKKNAFYVVVGYVGFLGFVVIIMEIIKLSCEKNGKETGGGRIPVITVYLQVMLFVYKYLR